MVKRKKDSPLTAAASSGSVSDLSLALNGVATVAPYHVNWRNHLGCTALLLAAARGHHACVRVLIAVPGVDVNQDDQKGLTPLLAACAEGHGACVLALLAVPGIAVSIARPGLSRMPWASSRAGKAHEKGATPLHAAAWGGHDACVRALLASAAADHTAAAWENSTDPQGRVYWFNRELNVSAWDRPADVKTTATDAKLPPTGYGSSKQTWVAGSGVQPVAEAPARSLAWRVTESGSASALQLVTNQANRKGQTPVEAAAAGGHDACVRSLVATGSVHASNLERALGAACEAGHGACVRALLDAPGISMDLPSLLAAAAGRGHDASVRALLAAKGAALDSTGLKGALRRATREGHDTCVQALLAELPIFGDLDFLGGLLCTAAEYGHDACVQLLLAANASANLRNGVGWTAVYLAANKGHSACVAALAAAEGVDVNFGTRGGHSPLFAAAKHGYDACVQALLSARCGEPFPPNCVPVFSFRARFLGVVLLHRPHARMNVGPQHARRGTPCHDVRGVDWHCACFTRTRGIDVNRGVAARVHSQYAGLTPLNVACQKGHTACVRSLLGAPGIDANTAARQTAHGNHTVTGWVLLLILFASPHGTPRAGPRHVRRSKRTRFDRRSWFLFDRLHTQGDTDLAVLTVC